MIFRSCKFLTLLHSVLFIRTSNFGAEADRSYVFLQFEAENVLKMFLNYMVYTTCISVNQALPAEIWYQELLIMTNRDMCHHTTQNIPVFWLIYICYLDFIYRLAK